MANYSMSQQELAHATHYVVDIRVQKVVKIVTTTGGTYNSPPSKTETEREVTELSHIVTSDKELPHLIRKAVKHLELLDESKGE